MSRGSRTGSQGNRAERVRCARRCRRSVGQQTAIGFIATKESQQTSAVCKGSDRRQCAKTLSRVELSEKDLGPCGDARFKSSGVSPTDDESGPPPEVRSLQRGVSIICSQACLPRGDRRVGSWQMGPSHRIPGIGLPCAQMASKGPGERKCAPNSKPLMRRPPIKLPVVSFGSV